MCQVRAPRAAHRRKSHAELEEEIRKLRLELAEKTGTLVARDNEILRLRKGKKCDPNFRDHGPLYV